MKHEIKNTDIAIITTQAVAKTFDNKEAYLHAVIAPVSDIPAKQTRTYKVRTDLVRYISIEVPVLDENGNNTLDENGNPIVEIKKQLTWIEQKQDWAIQKFSYAQIDGLSFALASQVPKGLTRTGRELWELQTMFLIERKNEAPWGVAAKKWRLRTTADLVKK